MHIHADLIAGLPGEDLATFARGFDTLLSWGPQEIQLGILKRLRGAPITRYDDRLTWSEAPPYEVLKTDAMDFVTLLHLRRVAKVWDLIGNSGNFVESTPLLWADGGSPFAALSAFTDFLLQRSGRTHGIALLRLLWLLYDFLVDERGLEAERVRASLERDYTRSGRSHVPRRLRAPASERASATTRRQARHRGPSEPPERPSARPETADSG